MRSEDRSIFLLVLTLIIYAVSSKINTGAFIFPFPLNELLFLGLTIYFTFLNQFRDKGLVIIVNAVALFGVISGIQNWAFVLSDQSLSKLDSGVLLDLLKIAYGLALLLWFFVSTQFEIDVRKISIQLLGVSTIIIGFIFNVQLFILAFALFTIFILMMERQLFGINKLWIAFTILEFTRFLSFALVDN